MDGRTVESRVESSLMNDSRINDSPRRLIKRDWLFIVLLVLIILLVGIATEPPTRQVIIVLALVVIGLGALLAELTAWLSLPDRRKRFAIPDGARPADGRVDLVQVDGVDAEPLAIRPELRKFVALAAGFKPITNRARTGAKDRPLLGRVALVSVFVGEDQVSWSDREIDAGHKAVELAGIWLEREAMRLGASLNLSLSDVYFQVDDDAEDLVELAFQPEGEDVGPMEANSLTKALTLASRAALKLGFADVDDWIGQINDLIDADSLCWFFHVRRAGRSMAITSADSGIPGVAFALCYAREASFPEPLIGRPRFDPATLTHELLHLFGASDKYGISLRSFPEGSVSSRDIMRLEYDSLARLRIDGLTAVEVGWTTDFNAPRFKKKPGDGSVRRPSTGG